MPKSIEEKFLKKIRKHPDDSAPRMLFKDWLINRNRKQEAALVRSGCKLAYAGGMVWENTKESKRIECPYCGLSWRFRTPCRHLVFWRQRHEDIGFDDSDQWITFDETEAWACPAAREEAALHILDEMEYMDDAPVSRIEWVETEYKDYTRSPMKEFLRRETNGLLIYCPYPKTLIDDLNQCAERVYGVPCY